MAAEQILLVNPRRRRRRKSSAKRRVSRRRARVTRVRRRRLRNPIGAYMAANPRRRRRRSRMGGIRRRRVRNPRFGGGGLSVNRIVRQLIPASIGAAGAVGLDVALAYIPIPEQYKTGWLGTGVKVAGAVALGMLAGKVVGKEKGQLFTAGALTVLAYQVLRNLASTTLGSSVKGLSGVADFEDLNLGAYMRPALPSPAARGVGAYMNPAAVLNGLGDSSNGMEMFNYEGSDYYN